MKIWIVSLLDEETIQGRKLSEEIHTVCDNSSNMSKYWEFLIKKDLAIYTFLVLETNRFLNWKDWKA